MECSQAFHPIFYKFFFQIQSLNLGMQLIQSQLIDAIGLNNSSIHLEILVHKVN